MTNERETIMATIWEQLYNVTGAGRVVRNPESPSEADDHPVIHIYELEDVIKSTTKRGGRPAYKRALTIAVEPFVAGTTEESASKELGEFVTLVKSALLSDPSLGGLCEIQETDSTSVAVVPGGDHIRGMGIGFVVHYTEQI